MINGVAHGPLPETTVCQLTLRHFKDGDELYLEPWRARAFPVLRDLMVDRTAFDRIIAAGGYISAPAGSAQDGNDIPVPKEDADRAMDAAACIGCGACVAACPNASASLFTGAKIAIWACFRKASRSENRARCAWWRRMLAGRLRKLHQYRRMRGGVPERASGSKTSRG